LMTKRGRKSFKEGKTLSKKRSRRVQLKKDAEKRETWERTKSVHGNCGKKIQYLVTGGENG